MKTRLRPTIENDLDFVLAAEHDPENSLFVTRWTREQHAAVLASADGAHFIIESECEPRRVGYIIMAGLQNPSRNIELGRIVVTEKNKGHGREALRLVKEFVFGELGAHRLWLDVKEHNLRARHVYQAEGFKAEGVLRECIKAETGFESLMIMSILREEYDRLAFSQTG